jgi:tetratricopeptide (TPR) repeat protein
MVGFLGMIGVILVTFQAHIKPKWFFIITALLIGLLGVRSSLRGFDWRNEYTLAVKNIATSKEDYTAYNNLGQYLIEQGDLSQAKVDILRSISIFPTFTNYLNLGVILTKQDNYPGAIKAYGEGLKYGNYSTIYENVGSLTLLYGYPSSDKQYLLSALNKFPQDPKLWMYLAILEDRYNDNADAKVAITKAASYGQLPQFIYSSIINNLPFTVVTNGVSIHIQ